MAARLEKVDSRRTNWSVEEAAWMPSLNILDSMAQRRRNFQSASAIFWDVAEFDVVLGLVAIDEVLVVLGELFGVVVVEDDGFFEQAVAAERRRCTGFPRCRWCWSMKLRA